MFGYTTFGELIKAIFKHFDSALVLKYLVPIVLFINTVFSFLFQSVAVIWFLILLYCLDFITGITKSLVFTYKAKKLKKQGLPVPEHIALNVLVSKKFPRFLITMFAAMILLAILNFAAIHSLVFMPLYSIFYAVFLGQNIISIVENGEQMGLFSTKIVSLIKEKIGDITKPSN